MSAFAIGEVLASANYVIDMRVVPEHARAVSSTVLRQIPNDQ
jgi:hypothetical protein